MKNLTKDEEKLAKKLGFEKHGDGFFEGTYYRKYRFDKDWNPFKFYTVEAVRNVIREEVGSYK